MLVLEVVIERREEGGCLIIVADLQELRASAGRRDALSADLDAKLRRREAAGVESLADLDNDRRRVAAARVRRAIGQDCRASDGAAETVDRPMRFNGFTLRPAVFSRSSRSMYGPSTRRRAAAVGVLPRGSTRRNRRATSSTERRPLPTVGLLK